ncbi:uncharacterized protein [Venturia canescens]|uniref:uncharacterized protein n=1 Tax=Venturia canescens TaxID=32260 RepID=UPI001C9BCC5C|nr:uncharacterized protein LOC122413887 [Venturia canescens]
MAAKFLLIVAVVLVAVMLDVTSSNPVAGQVVNNGELDVEGLHEKMLSSAEANKRVVRESQAACWKIKGKSNKKASASKESSSSDKKAPAEEKSEGRGKIPKNEIGGSATSTDLPTNILDTLIKSAKESSSAP